MDHKRQRNMNKLYHNILYLATVVLLAINADNVVTSVSASASASASASGSSTLSSSPIIINNSKINNKNKNKNKNIIEDEHIIIDKNNDNKKIRGGRNLQSCVNSGNQCGGIGYNGASCCDGLQCVIINDYWHGCEASTGGTTDTTIEEEEPEPLEGLPTESSNTVNFVNEYDYGHALHLSLLFYEAQRAGPLPADNRVPWRGDSALNDQGANGENLSGGWYDAGDHLKFGLPMAWSTTTLLWGLIEYPESYTESGEMGHMLRAVKWPLDYFINAHPSKYEFYVQVGNGDADHRYWGRPEMMSMSRPAHRLTCGNPGSEPVGETAAAMAAGYIAFKNVNKEYANKLLSHAKDLYAFADECQGSYVADGHTPAGDFYNSWNGYQDELAWGAAWLYKATGDELYKNKVNEHFDACCNYAGGEYSWDGKAPGVQLLMYTITKEKKYHDLVKNYLVGWRNHKKTPKGLTYWNKWAPNRYAANTAYLALLAADYGVEIGSNREWGGSQIHYMLGDCCGGINPETNQPFFSYLIGYGDNFPKSPHHRGSSCNENNQCSCSTGPNYNTLYGALVGGPGEDDSFADDCNDYVSSEVATDYNAGFTSAIAAMKGIESRNAMTHNAGKKKKTGYTPQGEILDMKELKKNSKSKGKKKGSN